MTTSPLDPTDPNDLGPLAEDLLFMMRTVQGQLRTEVQALRDALAVESGMIGVMSLIWQRPGISQNDLAAMVALKKSAVTKLVKELETRGLITRERVSSDRRMNALRLTETGLDMITQSRGIVAAIQNRAFEQVSEEDRKTFFRVLGNMFTACHKTPILTRIRTPRQTARPFASRRCRPRNSPHPAISDHGSRPA